MSELSAREQAEASMRALEQKFGVRGGPVRGINMAIMDAIQELRRTCAKLESDQDTLKKRVKRLEEELEDHRAGRPAGAKAPARLSPEGPMMAAQGKIRAVFYATGHVYEVCADELFGTTQRGSAVFARQVACYCALVRLDVSRSRVAEILRRDGSTITHAKEKIAALLDSDDEGLRQVREETRQKVEEIMKMALSGPVSRP